MPASVLILHTTEGSTIAGAEAAFRKNNSWPHVIYNPATDVRVQYLPYSQTARALRNMPGGVETNRRESDWLPGPDIIQVEIVGFASQTPFWGHELRQRLARFVIATCNETGVPIEFPYPFAGNEAYGLNGAVRLSPQQWLTARGILGHQHVPENTHWDPGAMTWLPEAVQHELNNMSGLTPDQNTKLDAIYTALYRRDYDGDGVLDTPWVTDGVKALLDNMVPQNQALGSVNQKVDALIAAVGQLADVVADIKTKVEAIENPEPRAGATADEIVDEIASRLSA